MTSETQYPPLEIELDLVEDSPMWQHYQIQVEKPDLTKNIDVWHCLNCDLSFLDDQDFLNHPCTPEGLS